MIYSKKTILVVDDSDYLRHALKKILEKQKFDVQICANGEDALALAKSKKFDLIVSDIIMPICDGFEFWERLTSEINPNVATPVLFMSGGSKTIKADLALSMLSDKSHVLKKPFKHTDFFQLVNSLVGIGRRDLPVSA